MFIREEYEHERQRLVEAQAKDQEFQALAHSFLARGVARGYAYYQWSWLGLPADDELVDHFRALAAQLPRR